jgi:polypeptide N-acetylgalactosaminyltransferase
VTGDSTTQRGIFTWYLQFSWLDIPPEEKRRRASPVDPVASPAMAGGLFSMRKDYFFSIGSYDMGMETWGGENLEMSFRIWMCGVSWGGEGGQSLERHPTFHDPLPP